MFLTACVKGLPNLVPISAGLRFPGIQTNSETAFVSNSYLITPISPRIDLSIDWCWVLRIRVEIIRIHCNDQVEFLIKDPFVGRDNDFADINGFTSSKRFGSSDRLHGTPIFVRPPWYNMKNGSRFHRSDEQSTNMADFPDSELLPASENIRTDILQLSFALGRAYKVNVWIFFSSFNRVDCLQRSATVALGEHCLNMPANNEQNGEAVIPSPPRELFIDANALL